MQTLVTASTCQPPTHSTTVTRCNRPPPSHSNTSNNNLPPSAIPYSSNSPADPSLWDGNFGSISLFGTNKFLEGDIRNITRSLSHITTFLKQRNLGENNGNFPTQLIPFGQVAWEFILTTFESGWDSIGMINSSSLGDIVKHQFALPHSSPEKSSTNLNSHNRIKWIPPPIPSYPNNGQIPKSNPKTQ